MTLWALLALHVVVGVAVVLSGRSRRATPAVVFGLAASAPAVTALVALETVVRGSVRTATIDWVPGLGLDLSLRLDPLSGLLTLLVSGIGVAVFGFSIGYFGAASGLDRFATALLAFSASMVGLVWSNSIWAAFLFWELTSVTSFLLVGHKYADPTARTAARRALVVTGAGGLVLLAGLVMLADASGTTRLRDLEPLTGTTATIAAVLIVVAAATKSAQVPFHVWLPGAMAAPTPVSAYLHSATMVKAGVILLVVLDPALGQTAPWTPMVAAFGLGSLLWGAVGALRQTDAKLILAWGTVSQLGLMVALLAVDDGKATFAALSILVAHAVFKATLFLVVGEIDVRTGTRDIRRLGGLGRAMPVACGAVMLAAASMAGIPPVLGFAAKEAGIEAALGLSGAERAVVLGGVVGGSVLTVAYTVRLVLAVFGGTRPADLVVAPPRPAMTVVTTLLATGSLLGFVALGSVSDAVRDAAVIADEAARPFSLLRWPGVTTAFEVSLGVVAVGSALGVVLARRIGRSARPLGAELVDALVAGVISSARGVARVVQHGSLPGYMVTTSTVVVLVAIPFLGVAEMSSLEPWDHPLQVVLGALVLVAALGMVAVRSRLGAALALGAVGFGVAGLFVVHGAPDLALTQLLVETVIVVGFVVGLGGLGRHFTHVGRLWRNVRILVAALVGAAVGVGLASSGSSPTGQPPITDLTREAVQEGGGDNIVNVVLTDVRALDTWGEIVVLVVVAVGVVALARAGRAGRAGGGAERPAAVAGTDIGEMDPGEMDPGEIDPGAVDERPRTPLVEVGR